MQNFELLSFASADELARTAASARLHFARLPYFAFEAILVLKL
jgi:hypothetical protein